MFVGARENLSQSSHVAAATYDNFSICDPKCYFNCLAEVLVKGNCIALYCI